MPIDFIVNAKSVTNEEEKKSAEDDCHQRPLDKENDGIMKHFRWPPSTHYRRLAKPAEKSYCHSFSSPPSPPAFHLKTSESIEPLQIQ